MALKEYGFSILKFPQIISIIKEENIASQRVAEKCGMALLKKTIIDQELYCIYSATHSWQ